VYGIQVQDQDDPYVRIVEISASIIEGLVTGAYPVDLFPICTLTSLIYPQFTKNSTVRHIPEWVPGAIFKKRTSVWQKYIAESCALAFREVRRRMVRSILVLQVQQTTANLSLIRSA
jgi:hypothetical protein